MYREDPLNYTLFSQFGFQRKSLLEQVIELNSVHEWKVDDLFLSKFLNGIGGLRMSTILQYIF